MINNLKPKEYEVMKFIWENETVGVTFGEIHDHANGLGKELTRQRTNAYIQVLMEKGFLKAEGLERRKIYYPLIPKHEYDSQVANEVIEQLFEGSLKKFVSALTGGQSLPEKTARELKVILKKRG